MVTTFFFSPDAAEELEAYIENGGSMFNTEGEDLQGETDCPDGCKVESDGVCFHGWLSAARTLGII